MLGEVERAVKMVEDVWSRDRFGFAHSRSTWACQVLRGEPAIHAIVREIGFPTERGAPYAPPLASTMM